MSPSHYAITVLAFAPTGHIVPTINNPENPEAYVVKKEVHHLKARILEVVTILHSLTQSPDLVAVECGRLKQSPLIGGNFLHRRIDVEFIANGSRYGSESKYAYNESTAKSGQIGTLRSRFKGSGLNIFTERKVGNFNLQGENILIYEREINNIVEFIIGNFRKPLSTDSAKGDARLKINTLLDLSLRQEELERNIHALNEIVDQLNKTKGINPVRTIVNGFQTWLDTTPTKRRDEYPSAPHFNGTFISQGLAIPSHTAITPNDGYNAYFRDIVIKRGSNTVTYNFGFQLPSTVPVTSDVAEIRNRIFRRFHTEAKNNRFTNHNIYELLTLLPGVTKSTEPYIVNCA